MPERTGDQEFEGNINATSFTGDGTLLLHLGVTIRERSSTPADPPEGYCIFWMSDGTGAGADGDIMCTITAGGSTKTGTVIDFSAV
jgi:hypothetical protein